MKSLIVLIACSAVCQVHASGFGNLASWTPSPLVWHKFLCPYKTHATSMLDDWLNTMLDVGQPLLGGRRNDCLCARNEEQKLREGTADVGRDTGQMSHDSRHNSPAAHDHAYRRHAPRSHEQHKQKSLYDHNSKQDPDAKCNGQNANTHHQHQKPDTQIHEQHPNLHDGHQSNKKRHDRQAAVHNEQPHRSVHRGGQHINRPHHKPNEANAQQNDASSAKHSEQYKNKQVNHKTTSPFNHITLFTAKYPGYHPSEVHADITDKALNLKGKSICGCTDNCIVREFERSINIPDNVDRESIRVTLSRDDGLLEVHGDEYMHNVHTNNADRKITVTGLGFYGDVKAERAAKIACQRQKYTSSSARQNTVKKDNLVKSEKQPNDSHYMWEDGYTDGVHRDDEYATVETVTDGDY